MADHVFMREDYHTKVIRKHSFDGLESILQENDKPSVAQKPPGLQWTARIAMSHRTGKPHRIRISHASEENTLRKAPASLDTLVQTKIMGSSGPSTQRYRSLCGA
ncbi:hypothetical protein MGYG_02728 [Nannizzia gypsea CBS 118893]|uniref:Uncharacterized protein n=1 Tax=Arthroderma gypseum (strain ATCC MYA-4604 / CBS 118893) TaxID=535722 RepID=E4UNW1_ARTGP|nr:hypothetical protein MGYG_02728 [Nannizzia gypsea CBS 118893]EFQ99714.1 hypothetical protein MGYG_02728 [Nannizzia gypsea CBS 118893]